VRMDRYDEPRRRTRREWLDIAESALLTLLVAAAVIGACILLAVLDADAAVPPRPRLARSLRGDRIASIVTNAAPGAKVSVPLVNTRGWTHGAQYLAGDTCAHTGAVYVCLQSHTALPGWQPPAAPALWRLVRAAGEAGIPAWRQPLGAHDAYPFGARVRHRGVIWTSIIDANVWEPGIYGWMEP